MLTLLVPGVKMGGGAAAGAANQTVISSNGIHSAIFGGLIVRMLPWVILGLGRSTIYLLLQ